MSSTNRSHMQQIHRDYMCLSVHGDPSLGAGSEEKERQDEEMKKGRGDKGESLAKMQISLSISIKERKKLEW